MNPIVERALRVGKQGWRRLYRLFWYGLAALVILIAVLLSFVRVFLPDVGIYREDIERFASQALGRTIRVETLNAKLDGWTPTFICQGVRMFDVNKQRELVRFTEARIGFDLLRSIWHLKPELKSVTVSGLDLAIIRQKNGLLSVQGMDLTQIEKTLSDQAQVANPAADDLSQWLFERSHLSILNSRVFWHDEKRGGKSIQFNNVNIKLRNDGKRHQLNGQVKLPVELGEELIMAVDFTGNILNPAEWQGSFFSQAKHVKAKQWGMKPAFYHVTLNDGEMDLQLWGGWAAQAFTSLSGYLTVNDVHLGVKGHDNPFALKLLSGLFDWRRTAAGWQLHVDNFRYQQQDLIWPETSFAASYQDAASPTLQFQSSLLRLADVQNLAIYSGLLTPELVTAFNEAQPGGELRDLHITLLLENDKPKDVQVSTNFSELTTKPSRHVPGFTGLTGVAWFDRQHGWLRLASQAMQLDFNGLFREPLSLTQLQGELSWWHDEQNFYLQSSQLLAANRDIQTDSAIFLQVPTTDSSPFLDLQTQFKNGNVANAGQFYPVAIMNPDLVKWLDAGLIKGQVTEGGVIFHGRLRDFPFRKPTGNFAVTFTGNDVELNYKTKWPHLQHMQLGGNFSGTGMRLTSSGAALFESKVTDVDVGISDFSQPVLNVVGKYQGTTRDVVQFLAFSPIAPQAKDLYNNVHLEGNNTATLQLQVPLADAMATKFPLTYSGKVAFINSGMSTANEMLPITQLNGELEYSTRGLFGKGLQAQIAGGKTDLFVFTHPIEGSQQVKIGMQGDMDIGRLLHRLQLPVADEIQGQMRWAGLLSFGYHAGGRQVPGGFNFDSDLSGVQIDLPEPIAKPATQTRHLNVGVEFPHENKMTVTFGLEKILRGRAELETADSQHLQLRRATLNFSDTEPVLPTAPSIRLSGRLENFSAATWQQVLADENSAAKQKTTAKLALPIELDMDYLTVTTGAMFGESASSQMAESPQDAPLINGSIRELVVDNMHLGKFDVATERDKEGMRIKKIDFTSDDMKIHGEGSWHFRNRQHQTNLLLDLDSPDVGNMLHRLGYAGIIRHGKAAAHVQFNWADAPSRFAFAKLDGTLGIVVNDGIIDQIEPGAGRLLGLLSLTELPRHLVLNFKEFSRGLSFDEIKGNFEFKQGNAMTENLNVDSPAAVIAIRGRTGFATRDYDLEVIAVPRVTSSLSLVGCLLTGGSTCGWVFFFDRLVGKSIDDSLAKRFSVQGGWEKPEIKEVTHKGKSQDATPK